MKHSKFIFCLLAIAGANISLRIVYLLYGYIPSEEGILIYGQKLAYSGLLPFVDYNAWNSLINNYIVGFYQLFFRPTIITQRIFGLALALLVFIFATSIAVILRQKKAGLWTALFLTFGSYTYLYLSNIPYSSQTMTASLLIAYFFLAKSVFGNKNRILTALAALIFTVLAVTIRIQALPVLLLVIGYLSIIYKRQPKKVFSLIILGIIFSLLIYSPFIIKSWDNFVYALIWPLKADKILVYQHTNTIVTTSQFVKYTLDVFEQYGVYVIIFGAVFFTKLFELPKSRNLFRTQPHQFLVFSALSGLALASTSLLHKPPYSTYIYPALPFFAYIIGVYLTNISQQLKRRKVVYISHFITAIICLLFLIHLATFPHVDYIKTSSKTLRNTPYGSLTEIIRYINGKTPPGSEILSFYLPAAAELDRYIPIELNEGEGSISILPDKEAKKYHLTNVHLLTIYISSKKARAIVMSKITPNFFGVNETEKQMVLGAIDTNYILDKSFTNFSMIGNPRVSTLYVYLPKP